MARITVIGFGKIGQALAAHILQHDINVTAIDASPELINAFTEKRYHTHEPGVAAILLPAYDQGRLAITNDYAAVTDTDAVIITIPLFIDSEKNIASKPFIECIQEAAKYAHNQTLIIIETSIPVGYGRNTILPAIEAIGKVHGNDFLLAHSPERIKSGTMLQQLQQIPKIIGGISPAATQKAFEMYSRFMGMELLVQVSNIETAEMLKLAGMIYRDVNIALSNQLAQFANASGINFAELIPMINTDNEANLLYPGIGVGGHCTPVYPYFMISSFKEAGIDFTLAKESRRINDEMAAYAVALAQEGISKKTALLLGLSFRPNVKEDALSTTYLLDEKLKASGFDVLVHDTEFTPAELAARNLTPAKEIYQTMAEVVILVTMHAEYRQLDFSKLAASGVKVFVDGRNAFERTVVESAGIKYIGIGK